MDLVIDENPIAISADLAAKVGGYIKSAKAPNTRRAYKASWTVFENWCRVRHVPALPASPATVAAFLADEADRFAVSSLQLRLAAIRQAHDLAHVPSPTRSVEVGVVMQGVRRRHGTAPVKKSAFMVGDIRALCGRLKDDLRGHRDRALLLVGFAGGFRRSELVALEVEDIRFTADGVVVSIRKSKTDKIGRGRIVGIGYGSNEETCPVTALRRWLTSSNISDGPLFRGVNRHGRLQAGRLSSRTVARVVQQRGKQVGLDPRQLGGHSLRSGFATSAAAAGVEERDIARVTGHRSLLVLRGYVQAGTAFQGDVVRRLGL